MTANQRVKRVLVVTNMWPTAAAPMGGIFVAEQVNSLRDLGLSVDVLFVNGSAEGWSAYLHGFGRVAAVLRQGRGAGQPYQLIHAHYVFSGALALVGRALAGQRIPIVLTQHGIETQVGWTAPLCRLVSRFVDVTVATSRRVQQALGRADAQVIPCGVDTALFRPMSQVEARADLGLAPDAAVVLFAGMRRPEKRLDLIEAAVQQLQARRPDAQLLVADSAPHEAMPLYMNAADVLVLASEAEGSPMVIKEALACNLPIVSVDVGDVVELIGGLPGCQIVARSVDGLADGLLAALTTRRRIDGRTAVQHLSLEAVAAQLNLCYQSCLVSQT